MPRRFLHFWLKLALGIVKNGFRASDLPPEGPKKDRRGNLSNLSKSQNETSGPSKMDSACQIYPQRVRKKSAEAIQAI